MTTDAASPSVGYARQEPTKAPGWHGLVAWDMLLNGMSTGLFLVAGLADLVSPATFAPVARVAYPVALLFLLADLTLLVLDLGDLLRFHHMLRLFKPGSPMSLGVWSLTVYSLPLTVATVVGLLPGGGVVDGVRKAAVVLAIVPAFASAAYKGVLLSTSAQPGWRDARWLGGYHTSAAVLLGCAEMVVLAYLTGQPHAADLLRPAFGILLVVHAVPLGLLTAELWPAARGQLRLGLILVAVGGVLLPLGLVTAGRGPAGLIAAACLAILGNLADRFVLIRLPHQRAGAS